MRRRATLPIRTRLALIYTALLAAALAVFGGGLFLVLQAQLRSSFDASLLANAHHAAGAFVQDVGADGKLRPSARLVEQFGSTGGRIEILDTGGNVIADSSPASPALEIAPADFHPADPDQPPIHTQTLNRETLRFVVHPISTSVGVVAFVVWAVPTTDTDNVLATVALAIILGGVLLTLVAFAAGWWLARRALAPISDVTDTARAVSLSGDFGGRVETSASPTDEVGELAVAFNEMLAALEENHLALQRFLGDASHQLRTPLTTLRTSLELLDRASTPPDARAELLADARSETERMARLVADLLSLARAESGARLEFAPVQLDEVLLEAVRTAATTAGGVHLDVGDLCEVSVQGDRDRLKELLLIVLDNAVRYTPAGGAVAVRLDCSRQTARIEIADTGIGIPPDERDRVFERLYRGTQARRLRPGGTGLGLPIANWIAEAHDGRIYVGDGPGPGTTMVVELPAATSTRRAKSADRSSSR